MSIYLQYLFICQLLLIKIISGQGSSEPNNTNYTRQFCTYPKPEVCYEIYIPTCGIQFEVNKTCNEQICLQDFANDCDACGNPNTESYVLGVKCDQLRAEGILYCLVDPQSGNPSPDQQNQRTCGIQQSRCQNQEEDCQIQFDSVQAACEDNVQYYYQGDCRIDSVGSILKVILFNTIISIGLIVLL